MEHRERELKELALKSVVEMPYPIVGKSRSVDQLIKAIQKSARASSDILVIGESGVGKGAVAKNIHALTYGTALDKTFPSVNLSVVDDKELEQFVTGASGQAAYDRLFGGSTGGTILFEEIEEASFRNQMKVLTFMTERENWLSKATDSGVRFIVTMKEVPQVLLERRKLLEELSQKLNIFERITIPPLRDRPEDIPLIVKFFVTELCSELGKGELEVDLAALDVLVRLQWKENIRELKAIVDKSVLFSTEGRFMLPPELLDEKTEIAKMLENIETGQDFVLDSSLDIIEKGIIERALTKFGFNQSRAAGFLGMTEQTLRYKLKRLGIQHSRSR